MMNIKNSTLFGFIVIGTIMSLALILFPPIQSFAEQSKETDFTVVTGEELKKNPTAVQILKNIEIAKQRMAEMLNATKQQTAHEKFIEEQRNLAKAKLEKDLAALNKQYSAFTPQNAFSSFVARVNGTQQAFYWDQFNYMNEKIKMATQAKEAILKNGGSYADAQAEFIKYASMTRTEMVKLVSVLNIKYGYTDASMQSYFDDYGKLPRYENDDVSVCYGCDKYEQLKEQMLAEHELEKMNQNS